MTFRAILINNLNVNQVIRSICKSSWNSHIWNRNSHRNYELVLDLWTTYSLLSISTNDVISDSIKGIRTTEPSLQLYYDAFPLFLSLLHPHLTFRFVVRNYMISCDLLLTPTKQKPLNYSLLIFKTSLNLLLFWTESYGVYSCPQFFFIRNFCRKMGYNVILCNMKRTFAP